MLQRVLPTTGLHHVREPAVNKVFSQGTLLHEHPVVCRHARIHLKHVEDLAANIHITHLLHINASKRLEPFLSSSSERSIQGCHRRNRQQPSFVSPNLSALASSRPPCLLHLHWRHASAAHTQASNEKLARFFEDNNISTQPKRYVPPIFTLTSGFTRPPARPPPLWLPQLA